ncbi:MAG: glycoside hydrolase family 38 C-terminal domain-containing protein [Phycisphaerae bacterium]
MALTGEWRSRIERWRKELPQHFYTPLQTAELSGFMTTKQLSPEQASEGDFQPMPEGAFWGGKWEYGWFRTELVTPEDAAGKRLVFRPALATEAVVFVNGRVAQGLSHQRPFVTLTREAQAGERFEILIEAYAGHGPRECHAGPTPPWRETVPEPPETQQTVGRSDFGIWQEEVYQLHIDVETLWGIRENIDPDSLRMAEIDEGLRRFTLTVDFELPTAQMLETVRKAREELQPLLKCVNGSTAPTMFAFGHGHLDTAWLWPLAETERKAARTVSNQLALAEEYPGYRFLMSQPAQYRMLREKYPKLYERLVQAVADGRVIADGGMWVEADTNISGGEALIRQFIHGKRFFRDELDTDSRFLWIPDVFGYSGALPQIMVGCGVPYFATAKIFWNYHGGDPFPHNTFRWRGIDGSEVITHLFTDYNAGTDPASVIRGWRKRVQKDGISTRLYPFGHGDGGGGPTRNHLEFARRLENLEGVPRMKHATPMEFFEDLKSRGIGDAHYVGELYYQCHRGTYTSQAKTKKGNRKSELALREAEFWGAVAAALKGHAFPAADVDEAWKLVLLNQFHDILPGSSIERVYDEAEAAYEKVTSDAAGWTSNAAGALVEAQDDGKSLTVFNSLNWQRRELVELPDGFESAADAQGRPLAVQETDGRRLAEVTVPACGWTTVTAGGAAGPEESAVGASEKHLENEHFRVELNDRGELVTIHDKDADSELAAGACNRMMMFKDVPTKFDAWDIDSMYAQTPVELPAKAEVEVVSAGPLEARLRVRRRLNESDLTQDIVLRRDSRRVDFETTVEWRESHKLLKVAFPVSVHADEAVHEIQFGHVRRPTHASRPFDADRFEVCNHKWTALAEEGRGCAVLNDCKYGVNVAEGSINLTLLKSALAPDMHADKGTQQFTYAFTGWSGPLCDSPLVRQGYELNVPVVSVPGRGGEQSVLGVDADNIVVETVKCDEDGSGDVIIRLYEAMRTNTRCTLNTALPAASACETDMLESDIRCELELRDGRVGLEFRPFEIKTVRLRMKA